MVSPKPSFGYEITWDYSPYNPSTEELDRLVATIEGIARVRPNAEFRERLFRLLTLYRHTLDMDATAPRPKNIRAELSVLRNQIIKTGELLMVDANGLSSHARRFLLEQIARQDCFQGAM